MKTLLIYPEAGDGFWNGKKPIRRYLRRKTALPPYGLLIISSMLPKSWGKKLVDLNVKKLTDEDINQADIVLISAMLAQSKSVIEVIKRCKEKNKTIVAGGPLFTETKNFSEVDHIFIGEAELTFPKFLQDLKKGTAKKIYENEPETFPDLTKVNILPDWSLINWKDYTTGAINFTRGCPYKCKFCNISALLGEKVRTKTPELFLQELENLYYSGWKGNVFIVDDNFIGNKTKTKELLRQLIPWLEEKKFPFKFIIQASINLAEDDELLQLLNEANFIKAFLGLESPSNESLGNCGKIQNIKKDVAEAVKKIHNFGIQVMAGFIVGFDTDTEEIFTLQEKFIQKIKVVKAMIGPLIAPPGSELLEELAEENRLILVGETTGVNDSSGINFIPKMGLENLLSGYKRLKENVFRRRYYYRRIHAFLKDFKYSAKGGSLSWEEFKAFLRTIVFIGIFSKDCPYYWRLLFYTIFMKTKSFSTVLEMAVERPYLAKN